MALLPESIKIELKEEDRERLDALTRSTRLYTKIDLFMGVCFLILGVTLIILQVLK